MRSKRTDDKQWPWISTGIECRRIRPPKGDPFAVEMWSSGFMCGVIVDGLLCVNEGYKFDGFTGAPDILKAIDDAKFHDILCQFQCVPDFTELVATRAEADELFFKHLRKSGVSLITSTLYFLGVKIGGLLPPKKHTGLSLTISLKPKP